MMLNETSSKYLQALNDPAEIAVSTQWLMTFLFEFVNCDCNEKRVRPTHTGATLFGSAADHTVWPCRFAPPDYSGIALS